MDANLSPYLPVVLALGVALFLGVAMVGINALFGPKRNGKVHTDPFACGNPPKGSARERFAVKYYLVAIFFLVFDVEVVFLLPWAVNYRRFLSEPGMAFIAIGEILFFIAMLVLALVFVWKAKALEWE
jgi:NADH-quinone oxidoreductase subunit A